jgi:NAD+ kinase
MNQARRVIMIHNPAKTEAKAATALVAASVERHAQIQATGVVDDTASLARKNPDRIVVVGGDGSILAVARLLADRQIPIIGVNVGKLGYLAEFSPEDVEQHLPAILDDASHVSRRMMIEGTVTRNGQTTENLLAVNDLVVLAGPPFRMIELGITVDGEHLTSVRGDGIVLATPSGSTAHNMSVGGPIIQSEVQAISVAPMSPHSLTHRPLVVSGDSVVDITAHHANKGTTVVVDGQVSLPLNAGDHLTVQRFAHDFQLVRNPAQHHWHTLIQKLKWGQ